MKQQIVSFNIWVLISLYILGQCIHDSNATMTWQGKWFPHAPESSETTESVEKSNKQNDSLSETEKWFPHKPELSGDEGKIIMSDNNKIPMGIVSTCDDAQTNLKLDFDPDSLQHSFVYKCLTNNKTLFNPDLKTQPILEIYQIPAEYSALHRCMNESIEYPNRLPTFGTHRPLWPKYGEYIYVPIQRWVHNLEHGAIVMLYHPCAHEKQVNKLKSIVKKCLYRHVITSSERLNPERPLAIVSWGKSLEMSVVDENLVKDFIKQNALHGPEKTSKDGQYSHKLITHSEIFTSVNDDNLCPDIQM